MNTEEADVYWKAKCAEVATIIGKKWEVVLFTEHVPTRTWETVKLARGLSVRPNVSGMYATAGLTFALLQRISEVCDGTKNINIEFCNGWGGTEVTPGDDATLTIHVRHKDDAPMERP
jgi:hypothetical protein